MMIVPFSRALDVVYTSTVSNARKASAAGDHARAARFVVAGRALAEAYPDLVPGIEAAMALRASEGRVL